MDAELYKPFKVCFSVFKATGMWQDGQQSWAYFFAGYALNFILIEFYILSQIVYLANIDNLLDFVDCLGLAGALVAQACKCYNFFYKLKAIKKSLEGLEALLKVSEDKRFPNRDHIRKEVEIVFKVYKIFWFSAVMTATSGAFVPIFSHALPYKIWFAFDTVCCGPGFWAAYIFLVVHSFVNSAIDMGLDILPVIFMSFGIGLLNELSERLSLIGSESKTDASNVGEFIECVEIHQKILKFVDEIQENFSTAIFLQGLVSSIILCACAFTMTTVSSIQSFSFF